MLKILNEYERAYENIKNFVQDEDNAEAWTKSYLLSLDEDVEVIRKLVVETTKPTLEEVKKEWENEGFEIVSFTKERIEIYKQWIERINHCSHHTFAKICIKKDFFYIAGQFSNKYTQLLTKTFKALG